MLISINQNADGLAGLLERLTSGLPYILPELLLVNGIVLILAFDLLFQDKKQVGLAALAFTILAFSLVFQTISFSAEATSQVLFEGLISVSPSSAFFKIGFSLVGLVVLLMAFHSKKYRSFYFESSEWLISILALILGAHLMTMSTNLLMLYVSIEVVSISSYMLSGLAKGKEKSEAAIKYLLYGAAASAAMLYGMSWLYGLTGTLDFNTATFWSGLMAADPMALSLALFLVLLGLLFKLGAFPLHVWSPDVYQAIPLPTVTLFSIVPKLAAVLVLMQFKAATEIEAFDWSMWLGLIAIGGMIVGNFSALWQRNAKRMMAYSSIAHAGFMLSGILLPESLGAEAVIFYGFIYLLMNLAGFYSLQFFENELGELNYQKFEGIGKAFPAMSIFLLLVFIALTGLPPTAGFNAKLFLFSTIYEQFSLNANDIIFWVFVVGLLNTVVSLFYYIRIPYLLFFKEGNRTNHRQTKFTWQTLWSAVLVLPILLFFFRSDWFVDLMNSINFVF